MHQKDGTIPPWQQGIPQKTMKKNILMYSSVAMLVFSGIASAQQPFSREVNVNGGKLLQEMKSVKMELENEKDLIPTVQPSVPVVQKTTKKADIKQISIEGNTKLPFSVLSELTKKYEKEVTMSELHELCDLITQKYREKGFLLAKSYIPPQEVVDGKIKIIVMEGYYDKVNVLNKSLIENSHVNGYFQSLSKGNAIQSDELQRQLLLVNDLKGVFIKSMLKPGSEKGTSSLDIEVTQEERVNGFVTVDNSNNKYTDPVRTVGSINIISPLSRGDLITLTGATSGKRMMYGQANYQTPIDYDGVVVGGSLSALSYKLGDDYEILDATGTATTEGLFASYPLIRSRDKNLSVQIDYNHKNMTDKIGVTELESKKKLDTIVPSFIYKESRWGGLTRVNASVSLGVVGLDNENADEYNTEGSYNKIFADISRIQPLSSDFLLYGKVSGQTSGKNLDSAEKMSLGGPYGVRAYPQGESSSDEAVMANVELQYHLLPSVDFTLFYDFASGKTEKEVLSSDKNNTHKLSGTGLGVAYHAPYGFEFNATAAWKLGDEPTSDNNKSPRIWAGISKTF